MRKESAILNSFLYSVLSVFAPGFAFGETERQHCRNERAQMAAPLSSEAEKLSSLAAQKLLERNVFVLNLGGVRGLFVMRRALVEVSAAGGGTAGIST